MEDYGEGRNFFLPFLSPVAYAQLPSFRGARRRSTISVGEIDVPGFDIGCPKILEGGCNITAFPGLSAFGASLSQVTSTVQEGTSACEVAAGLPTII